MLFTAFKMNVCARVCGGESRGLHLPCLFKTIVIVSELLLRHVHYITHWFRLQGKIPVLATLSETTFSRSFKWNWDRDFSV